MLARTANDLPAQCPQIPGIEHDATTVMCITPGDEEVASAAQDNALVQQQAGARLSAALAAADNAAAHAAVDEMWQAFRALRASRAFRALRPKSRRAWLVYESPRSLRYVGAQSRLPFPGVAIRMLVFFSG